MLGSLVRLFTQFGRRETPSLFRALYKIVPSRVLETEICELEDWRIIVSNLSKKLRIAEDALWLRIADELGVQFIERIPSCNYRALPSRISVADLRRVGTIPLQKGSKIVALICVDPKRAATLGLSGPQISYYLAPWAKINQAITDSESISQQLQHDCKSDNSERSSSSEEGVAAEVLRKVIEEVITAEQSEVEFEFGADKITYVYLGHGSTKRTGEVSVRINNSLLRLFLSMHNNVSLSESLPFGVTPVVQFMAGSLTKVRVSWHRGVTANQASFDSPLVLIVDDNPVFAKVLERFLGAHNFRSQSFSKAREAMSWLAAHPMGVSAVVCDLHMPEVDGFRFLKELKGDPRLTNLPVVALTSDTTSEVEIEALKLGVDAFITKNEDPLVVLLHVQRLTRRLKAA